MRFEWLSWSWAWIRRPSHCRSLSPGGTTCTCNVEIIWTVQTYWQTKLLIETALLVISQWGSLVWCLNVIWFLIRCIKPLVPHLYHDRIQALQKYIYEVGYLTFNLLSVLDITIEHYSNCWTIFSSYIFDSLTHSDTDTDPL